MGFVLYSTKKEIQLWDWTPGKNKTLYSKVLIENLLIFIILLKFFIWLLDMGTKSKWKIQEDRETSRKSNKYNKFTPLKCPSWKIDVWNEYTKTKGLHYASKYLICKRLSESAPGSSNDNFHLFKLPLNHTTRSSSTLKVRLCTLAWNN